MSRRKSSKVATVTAPARPQGSRFQLILSSLLLVGWLLFLASMAVTA